MSDFKIEKISSSYLVKNTYTGSVFSEHETYLDAVIYRAIANQGFSSPPAYWVEGEFLMEGSLGGKLISEINEFEIDISSALKFSQEEFDELMNLFFEEHGYYPDS